MGWEYKVCEEGCGYDNFDHAWQSKINKMYITQYCDYAWSRVNIAGGTYTKQHSKTNICGSAIQHIFHGRLCANRLPAGILVSTAIIVCYCGGKSEKAEKCVNKQYSRYFRWPTANSRYHTQPGIVHIWAKRQHTLDVLHTNTDVIHGKLQVLDEKWSELVWIQGWNVECVSRTSKLFNGEKPLQ